MKIRITGKGQNRALIDPLTGKKIFISGRDNKTSQDPFMALQEAIL